MKKFVNDPKQFVPDMLEGLALANPDTLKYVPEYNLIMRADGPDQNKVSIVQGSGSGHEPAHVMIVGKGMLDAACPGDVFAAPPFDYVFETTKMMASPKGVLLLVNNYTGDKMVFDMAQEMSSAEGIMARGNASLGDKTLLDALVPATDELERQLAAGAGPAECRAAFAKTVRECADATSELQARRGRASYSGERSIGSPDAGAVAIAIITESITAGWDQR